MRAAAGTTTLPRVNTPVLLGLPDVDHDVASRVEDLRGDLVAVAAVAGSGVGRRREGDVLTLAWAVPPRGLLSVTCVLVGREGDTPPLWLLRPQGPMRRLQRRRYARADVGGRVVLTGGDAITATGQLADLSEGGARVLLEARAEVPAEPGGTVVIEIALPGCQVRVTAVLVGTDRLAAGRQQVRLQFDLPEHEAEQVRRAVMQRQLDARCREER